MKVWIDDIRQKPKGYDIWIKTTDDAIAFIKKEKEKISLLDLDHDAGEFYTCGGDYIKILDWLEYKNISLPISIHSGNPVGIKNMMKIIQKNKWKYIPQEDEIICDIFI